MTLFHQWQRQRKQNKTPKQTQKLGKKKTQPNHKPLCLSLPEPTIHLNFLYSQAILHASLKLFSSLFWFPVTKNIYEKQLGLEEIGIYNICCSHIYLMLHCCSTATSSQVQQKLVPHQQKQNKMITSGNLFQFLDWHSLFTSDELCTNFQDLQADLALDTTEDIIETGAENKYLSFLPEQTAIFVKVLWQNWYLLRIFKWTDLAVTSWPSEQKRLEQPETATNLSSNSLFLDFSEKAHNISKYLKHNQAKFKMRIMVP